MGNGKDGDLACPGGNASWSDRWITGVFLLFLAGLSAAAAVLLFRDGKGWAFLIALVVGALLWALRHFEIGHLTASARGWGRLRGDFAPMVIISLVAITVYLPTLNSYFTDDDFAYINNFQTPSLSQLVRLFHTDIAQVLWGQPFLELRPFYGLYYMVSYQLWGLDPLGYHLSSVLLHVINSLLVFLIVTELAPGESGRGVFAGLLYVVLPVHSRAICWITGLPAEGLPTLLYLVAFLSFVRFRVAGLSRYIVISTSAFAGCLLSKETALTLPVMLVCYDLFRKLIGENGVSNAGGGTRKRGWQRPLLAYLPFAVLLLAYLALRRIAFASIFSEGTWERIWSGYSGEGAPGLAARFAHLLKHFASLQAFDLRQLLVTFPTPILGVVLGLYLFWGLSFLRRPPKDHKPMELTVCLGLVWCLISSLPLLAVDLTSRYLYLPAVGFCIATAFWVLPAHRKPRLEAGSLRLLGAVLLILLSASQLWKQNKQDAHMGEVSERIAAQLATALRAMPSQNLVIIREPEEYIMPFVLQPPFTSADLYSRARIIEFPSAYCCPLSTWWEKTRLMLGMELAGAPDAPIEIHLLAWDQRRNSLEHKRRVLPRGLLRTCVTTSLGGPLEAVNSVGQAQANRLVEALARLVAEGS